MIFLSPCRFQSTFPRGERHLCWLVAVKHIHFNPRSLVGNDYIPVGTYTIVEISIHVPSWGTTIFTRRQPPCILFQSTVPRGERRHRYQILRTKNRFQSTFPRGERRTGGSQAVAACNFNPRSLVGNDGLHFHRDWRRFISIHVPSWGTTITDKPVNLRYLYFNPRSLVGNDSETGSQCGQNHISIHVPSWGTTEYLGDQDGEFEISIHVPSWGTTGRPVPGGSGSRISIHVPSWGTTLFNSCNFTSQRISIHVPSWGTTANFHKYSLFFYAINIIFLLFIIPSLFSLVLFMLLF